VIEALAIAQPPSRPSKKKQKTIWPPDPRKKVVVGGEIVALE
jgi:hypothetical protein